METMALLQIFVALLFVCLARGDQDQCTDHVTGGLTCADLPDPCNNSVGLVTCPKFCGTCPDVSTNATVSVPGSCSALSCLNGGVCVPQANSSYSCQCPVTHTGVVCHIPTGAGCSNAHATFETLGCKPAEIVFLIEYGRTDNVFSIDHEGDFIKELVDAWDISEEGVRVGVVVYHNTVREAIHIGDMNDKEDLQDKISSLTKGLRGSGDTDLAKALDFVRQYSFTGARSGVEKIVVPIVHQMHLSTKGKIVAAAQRLKDTCTTLLASEVYSFSLDRKIIAQAVTQPSDERVKFHSSFNGLENWAKYFHTIDCTK